MGITCECKAGHFTFYTESSTLGCCGWGCSFCSCKLYLKGNGSFAQIDSGDLLKLDYVAPIALVQHDVVRLDAGVGWLLEVGKYVLFLMGFICVV